MKHDDLSQKNLLVYVFHKLQINMSIIHFHFENNDLVPEGILYYISYSHNPLLYGFNPVFTVYIFLAGGCL